MYRRQLLYLVALAALCIAAEDRSIHRLVGGHLRIINLDPDDSEFLKTEASGSRDKKQKSDHDEKKTLSQQVADGKYALIQKELFSKPPKRPGVLSYDENPEVPKDNKENLGGLNQNDIWLAENHLLVLKGGLYPPHEEKHENIATAWPPIDNYKAPLHQVKIPAHPKVPPPFPVQFTDDGPLQILGTNSSRTINGTLASAGYAVPAPEAFDPITGTYYPPDYPYSANVTSWQTPLSIPVNASGEYPEGVPLPPFLLNGTLPPYFASLPPGAAILPPPDNQTDVYDEDDPSIYYPPPYSFYYPKDNSSIVPPGPLVPGLILPPPPNFFAPLEETTTTTVVPHIKATKPPRQRKPITTEAYPQLIPTTTPLPPTDTTTTKKHLKVYPVHDSYYTNEIKPTISTTTTPKVLIVSPVYQKNRTSERTAKPQLQKNKPQVTILRPVKPSTLAPGYGYENEISNKPYSIYGPPKSEKSSTPATTQVPLKFYTTSNEIETNSVTQPPVKVHISSELSKGTLKPAQYYFYEELDVTTHSTPVRQSPYFDIPNEYYVQAKPTAPLRQTQQQYIYVNPRPRNTQKPKFRFVEQPVKTDTFSIHIARLQNQINQYYTTPKTNYRPIQPPKPVYQFSFQAANYQPQQNRFKPSQPDTNQEDQFRPLPKYSVQIQQAVEIIPTEPEIYQQTPSPIYYQQGYQSTTQKPGYYYTTTRPNYSYEADITPKTRYVQNTGTSRPITQYSFEVTSNPIYQGFYTKPDEGYFDDNTKKYFTVFGKKLLSSTSPIPDIEHTTAKPNFQYNNNNRPNPQYQQPPPYQKPISLETDTLVNYVHPRPPINSAAEQISINEHVNPSTDYPKVVKYPARPPARIQTPNQLPQREENPDVIKAVSIEVPIEEGQEGSFISYQLPGDDGAHFYFLTPQLAQRRDQGAGYYYSQPDKSRTRRSEHKDRAR